MKIRVGYEMIYDFPQPTPMIMVLGAHFTRASDVIVPDYLTTDPSVTIVPYRDGADSDEAGHAFQFEAGRAFRSEAGHPLRRSHGSIS
ncbi:hypothetical protein ABIF99_000263 [Bradyrhizobium japonicum]|nr:hypothetical protein [Bradyrhizobium japonicum]MCP1855265.1 hypothetical protein [Bradyrhizobium japonicum]MCP1897986.1 hypothetical protein [Bradyrhizobium japonicum]MCW2331081.1 hypothetical protein [Bradyrhizobium japonicum]